MVNVPLLHVGGEVEAGESRGVGVTSGGRESLKTGKWTSSSGPVAETSRSSKSEERAETNPKK